jgi:hypothetical protein
MANIKEFIANMSKSGGFARPSQYEVIINGPQLTSGTKGILVSDELGNATNPNNRTRAQALVALNQMQSVNKQITLQCQTVTMPSHDLQTQNRAYASEPGREMVQTHGYAGTIDCTFLLSNDLREKHYFEQWQALAVDNYTHKANYYDDYIGSMEIYQLSTKAKQRVQRNSPGPHVEITDEKHDKFEDERTYGILASEVYPKTIGAVSFGASSANEISTLDVRFEFRQWYNLGTDGKFGKQDAKLRPFDLI